MSDYEGGSERNKTDCSSKLGSCEVGQHTCSISLLSILSPAVLGGVWALATINPMTKVKRVGEVLKTNPEERSLASNRQPTPGPAEC